MRRYENEEEEEEVEPKIARHVSPTRAKWEPLRPLHFSPGASENGLP